MYIYIGVYIYKYIYIYTYVYINIYIYIYTYVYKYIYMKRSYLSNHTRTITQVPCWHWVPTWQFIRARGDIRIGKREIEVVPKPPERGAGVKVDRGISRGTGNSLAGGVCEFYRCTGDMNWGAVLESGGNGEKWRAVNGSEIAKNCQRLSDQKVICIKHHNLSQGLSDLKWFLFNIITCMCSKCTIEWKEVPTNKRHLTCES